MLPNNVTAANRYTQLEADRNPFLLRARACATLTIPSLQPPEGATGSTILPTPYQSLGARGVNFTAAKLVLALFPPNAPFFRMEVDDFTLEKVTQQPGMRAEVEKALNRVERAVTTEIEQQAIRVSAHEALRHLINSGNVLCYLPPDGGMRVFHLDKYVVARDPMGNVLEIIVKEHVSPTSIKGVLAALLTPAEIDAKTGDHKSMCLYTRVWRNGNHFRVQQEIEGKVVPGSEGSYPIEKTPWLPLRWTKIDGENYGRGHVEEYFGDLVSLESLTKSIVEGSAVSAKVVFLVNPNGVTNAKLVTEAESGAVLAGRKEDISTMQVEKFADFQITFKAVEDIAERISYAFMLNSAVQRNGERVTAEEIRYVASELDDSFGGVYSILSQDFQYRLVTCLIARMERAKKLPPLPKDLVKPTITTGLEALGRGQDLTKLQTFLSILGPLGPEAIATYMNVDDFITRAGTSLGLDMDGLVKTPDQIAQAQQMQTANMAMQKLGPKGMDIVRDQMKPGQQGAPNGPQQ